MKPFAFQWHVTDRCNLCCRHCYQDDWTKAAELGFGALTELGDRVLRGLAGRPVTINLTGGEPFALPGLAALVEHLHRAPNLESIHIITNGVEVGDALERLARLPKLGALKVSLESADEALNDDLRGKGNFRRVLAALPRLRAARPVVLMTTLSRRNAAGIETLVALAREHGLAGVIFERFVPWGRGLAMAGEVLDALEWQAAALAIARQACLEVEPDDLLPYRAFWLALLPDGGAELEGALCNLGDESMALMPDGAVYPCRRLPLKIGDALREPFADILERLQAFAPDVLGARLHGDLCGLCGVIGCAGCRALALATTGDLLGDDPQCPLRL